MSYTPPDPEQLHFQWPVGAYSPPASDQLHFQWAGGGGVWTAQEAPDAAAFSGTHSPPITGVFLLQEENEAAAITGAQLLVAGGLATQEDLDHAAVDGVFYSRYTLSLQGQEAGDSANLTGSFSPHYVLSLQAQEGADTGSGWAFHDWAGGLNPAQLQTLYTLTLTDPAGLLPDLILPMSSFQATAQTEGLASFLSCVIPAALPYADAITERLNGELVVSKGYRFADGTVQTEEILRIPLGEIRLDEGPNRASATLSGYGIVAPGTPKVRALTGIRYRNRANGLRRVRADVDLFLRPGDTALDGSEAFTVSYISYYVGPEGQFMEAAERAL